jgi:uncharacterized membrane protein
VPDTLKPDPAQPGTIRPGALAPALRFPRRLLVAAVPLLLTGALLPVLFLLFGVRPVGEGIRLVALSCLSSGRLVTLEVGVEGLLEPFLLAAAIAWVDLCFAFPLAYNLDRLHRLPYGGRCLLSLEARSRALLRRSPGKRAATAAALVLFVALPFGGTGAVGGAFFGRLLGLSRGRTLAGIALGSLLGNASLALGAHLDPEALHTTLEHPVFGPVGAAAALCMVGVLAFRMRAVPPS